MEYKDTLIGDATTRHAGGRDAEAEAICHRILAADPTRADAMHLLATMAWRQGRKRPAMRLAMMAVNAAPLVADYHNTLGVILAGGKRIGAAVAAFHRAIELRPTYAEAHHNLGFALAGAKRWAQAVDAYRKSLELAPANVEALLHLGQALRELHRFADAAEQFHAALTLDPTRTQILVELAGAYGKMGDSSRAVAYCRRVCEAWPNASVSRSNLLFTMLHADGTTPGELVEAAREWGRRHASALATGFGPVGVLGTQEAERAQTGSPCHDGSRDAKVVDLRLGERRLRIGYLSPDFRRHPVAAFFEPVLAGHDPAAVEVFCYSDAPTPDATTQRIEALSHGWRQIAGLKDADVERMIRGDGIDILIELAGHTAGNRLTLMGRRPAPVQMTYLGYPGTTGVSAIDWKITDDVIDPPGATDGHYTEKLLRVAGCSLCFEPCGPDESLPAVNELPALKGGYVTFSSLNRMQKATPTTIRLWAAVLLAVPGSRLLLRGGEQDAGTRDYLRSHGLDLSRVMIVRARNRAAYFERFHQTDIALDSFPYTGATTTCDGLWMGVPAVTWAGQTHASRVGASILTAVGLPELVADDESTYVQHAAQLACDLPKLSALRRGMRDRLRASPLADGRRLARELERCYRVAWEMGPR